MASAPASPATVASREQSCEQCGGSYRARRRSSRYCSNACRMKGKRGTAPATARATLSPITRALLRLSLAGPISPVRSRTAEPTVAALTVPRSYALGELQLLFDRNGWGSLTEAEFGEALTSDGIRPYSTDAPAASERKRLQARQRVATGRRERAA